MNTEELIHFLNKSDLSALDLLAQHNPQIKRRFTRAVTSLKTILDEVRQAYPDACYYVNADNLALTLGDPKKANEIMHGKAYKTIAAISSGHNFCGRLTGGDWK